MKSLHSLNRLIDLREREVDCLQADVAAKETLRRRYRGNIDRLEELCGGSGASGTLAPVLALNCGAFKQAVLQLAASHRESLALHEADMAVMQGALAAASRRHESLGQVLARQREQNRLAEQLREQKGQDELAGQVWARGSR